MRTRYATHQTIAEEHQMRAMRRCPNILSAIQAHAAAKYPKESCGLLLSVGRKQQYYPCRNVSSEPNEEFRIEPEQYAEAEDIGEVIGIVHSQPDATVARPDLAMCEATELPWHILSWPEGPAAARGHDRDEGGPNDLPESRGNLPRC